MIIGKAITAGGSGGIKCKLNITTSPGAVVTATLGEKVFEAVADENGIAILILNKKGIWTVTATLDGMTITKEIDTSFSIEKNLFFFPAEPSSYEYMALITSSRTWTAPEDGYFQIELFGASGKGGSGYNVSGYYFFGGGGGGGGAYSCSNLIKLNKGDTVVIDSLGVGSTAKVTINSSLETYSVMSCVSGGNGDNASGGHCGDGGAGGTSSGGNVSNVSGGEGRRGTESSGGKGGSAAVSGGNVGGTGGTWSSGSSGATAFVKIYRGDTNVVA